MNRGTKSPAEGLEDFRMILGASLSLLALLIGFTLSMSINGFNSRQAGEEMEAAAINAAYIRMDLLPAEDGPKIQSLLIDYLDKRLQFYGTHAPLKQKNIHLETIDIQNKLWSSISLAANSKQTPITALTVTGINDVLSTQRKTQANWRNQIPLAAWLLLSLVAACCNVMLGYNARGVRRSAALLLILPLMISMSFMMIGDIDAPGRGIIRVKPVNLEFLNETLKTHRTLTTLSQ
ncbi:hypothetical protein JFU48_25105 [Pseudomonas sp. TH49]|uniref:bestrophin-like domain n=1 Tax=Pseudomonas sp. TH49 TaxID=2796413 RepID=UPI0019114126|nr:hypothetical protein [Pseudomonas sp. TH49]MBK5344648.1 hypothetical protein [Pseudomonas sp. TH49]